ncbi:hypothetical protein [Dyadobacter jiangsuensis]|uniref:Uncharacterized protein n=1 Tax=Dyadobacter jiangsuensis TaxID=1591085 RepID=A0A2P8FXS1_9BACT|nr:hypothetical protein [Dyadobacter jiangsuensis]PSL26511.1 hypothetical protein CLV60_1092 [Dyadobacter jiangsuensis]
MKEKIRHLIAGKIIEQGEIKLLLYNLARNGGLTDQLQNQYLDRLNALEEDIENLKKALKILNE